jgi:hypothetical protein
MRSLISINPQIVPEFAALAFRGQRLGFPWTTPWLSVNNALDYQGRSDGKSKRAS